MNDNALITRLKQRQAQFALESLQKPGERGSYDYGFRVGVVAGYERAIDEVLALLKEEREDRRF